MPTVCQSTLQRAVFTVFRAMFVPKLHLRTQRSGKDQHRKFKSVSRPCALTMPQGASRILLPCPHLFTEL